MGCVNYPIQNSIRAGKEIEIQYIQPGRPMQNAYIERFNRTFRESILDAYLFEDTPQVYPPDQVHIA